MILTEPADTSADAELTARLDRLAARREATAPRTSPAAPTSPSVDAQLAARVQRLDQRTTSDAPIAGATPPRKRRRHAAQKSRVAALALSLVTTGGLSATFAATDGPSSSVVTASGGLVSAAPAVSTGALAAAMPASSLSQAATMTSGQASTAAPSTPVPAATSELGSVGAPATPSSAAAPAEAAAADVNVINGDVFTNKWGPVQVQVTFAADGSLQSVDAIQVPFRDNKSVRINDRAVPTLNSEALASQSAQVDTISGATYTSNDYERSLQSAIDTARRLGLTELA